MIRRALAALALVALVTGVAGCGGDDSGSSSSDEPTKTINVTFNGDTVTPNGDRVEVKVGQKIQFVVQADVEGEIHVHSSPEHEYDYGAGTTTLPTFTIDKPGIVTVESHALNKTIVQLEVK